MTSALHFVFPLGFKSSESSSKNGTETTAEFMQRLRRVTGLKKEDVFCNLRVPEKEKEFSTDDISAVVLTGRGVFCIDVKTWRGKVCVQNSNWQIHQKEKEASFSTRVEQTEDALRPVKRKSQSLCSHLKQSGVRVRDQLFIPRLLFLSPDLELDQTLRDRPEIVSQAQIQDFLCSFREGYVSWITDALTPAWISGHLSYSTLDGVRSLLSRAGTWDILKLQSGETLRGDFQLCPFIALDRSQTQSLEFSRRSLWRLLGHTPQVTVQMCQRGPGGWRGQTLSASVSFPASCCVLFRVCGAEQDSRIPASDVSSISLSI
ncbi:unnamed protein product [Knipowitschia caucasica]